MEELPEMTMAHASVNVHQDSVAQTAAKVILTVSPQNMCLTKQKVSSMVSQQKMRLTKCFLYGVTAKHVSDKMFPEWCHSKTCV